MSACIACYQAGVETVLLSPALPISNDYHKVKDAPGVRVTLELCVCSKCGLIQLKNPPSPEVVRPRYPMLYNEPESHLDDVVRRIIGLPGIDPSSTFLGLTYKEDSTLKRLSHHSFNKSRRLDIQEDYEITAPCANLETIQQVASSEQMRRIADRIGRSDVVIARHILEHAHAPRDFLANLFSLVKDGGFIVLEVPDCSRALKTLDYTTLWEEHISYFTKLTLSELLARSGLEILHLGVYPQPYEDSLVVIAKKNLIPSKGAEIEDEVSRAHRFGRLFPKRMRQIENFLSRVENVPCALFGAGHLATAFVHLAGVVDHVAAVFDDDPAKNGLALPGTSIPILSSSLLSNTDIPLTLLTMNPLSEEAIVRKCEKYSERGSRFLSIFPSSTRSMFSHLEGLSDEED